ncbi:mucin-2-like isoform X2 [Salvelinus fontinalis]|uniref:mucin-2-like isoform X2 n=1 Tax=Salvelinus fontinalis TaxID=8038 RepID=UPI002485FE48|nr:mucin-2-like isoform X2 [Salvelinus fontinalis]
MNLAFSSSSVPNITEIGTVLINAEHNITALDIDPSSVTVNSTAAPATSTVPPTTSVTTTVAGATTATTGEPVTVPATVPTTRPTTTTTTYVAPTTTVSRTTSLLSTTTSTAPTTTTTNAPTTTTTRPTTTTTSTTTTTTTPTTTSTPTTTTAHLQPAPLVFFVIQQVFVEALNDPQSTQFQELAVTITAVFDVIYKAKYGILFIRTIVLGFTPIFRSRMDAETQAEVQLVFNDTSTQSVPEVTDISNTLKEAVTNPNITFGNLSVDVTTITVKAAPATSTVPPTTSVTTTVAGATTATTGEPVTVPATVPTTRPTTTTTTYVAPTTTVSRTTSLLSTTTSTAPTTTTTNAPATTTRPTTTSTTTTTTTPTTTTSTTTTTTTPTTTSTTTTTTAHLQPAPLVVFIIQQVFVEALNDPQSTQFQELAVTITAVFDVIYKAKYGILFIRTIVLGFTPIFRSRMDAETQAEVQLVFNETSTESVPEVTDISNTLKEAVTNPNITFGNLSVDVTTITVKVPTTNANTTTMATPVITTSIITTTTTETAAVALTKLTVVFRSRGETFTSDLSNPSSQAFQSRALLIKTQLEPFYRTAFTSFNSLTVTEFSSGSIINTMNLAFSSSSVPNSMDIGTVLKNAAQKITAFNIDPTSVTVNGTAVTSSGGSSKTSLFTALFLVVLSLLLSSQH